MTESAPAAFVGTWRITDMEVWSQDAFDLLGPAYLKIDGDGMGRFRFIAIEGDLDCRFSERDGKPCVEWSWIGNDERDVASGRGWAFLDGGRLTGRVFIHASDDSAFTAQREDGLDLRKSRRRRRRAT